ncbi:MAG: class I SAM-dependent methyltransferase [Bacteroidota bacterium]
MENTTHQNEIIWDQLAQEGVLCSIPKMDLTPAKAQEYIGKPEFYGESLQGKQVLCLACGGGQQSIAFALLGAEVTVVDFSERQLEKEALVAQHYHKVIKRVKTDMRDLSMFADKSFDIVYQPYSINYVSSVLPVFDEITRVLRPGGVYDLMFHNPYVHGTWKDGCWGSEWQAKDLWQGKGYPIWQPYVDGHPIQTSDPHWNFYNQDNQAVKITSPQEYRHTLSTVLNGLISRGFEILRFQEESAPNNGAAPGSWEHYQSVAPPWLYLISRKK